MTAQKREKQAEKRQEKRADAVESKSTTLKNTIMVIMSQMVTFQADEPKQNTTCFQGKNNREKNPRHVNLTEASRRSVEEKKKQKKRKKGQEETYKKIEK